MHKLVFSPLARADLTDIGDYIANDLHNPGSALKRILNIKKAVGTLAQFPEMGTRLMQIRFPRRIVISSAATTWCSIISMLCA